jgi:hypothetical protein
MVLYQYVSPITGQWSDQGIQKGCLLFEGNGLIKVSKKLVSSLKSTHVSVPNESILQINLTLTSPNLVLTFYTYKVSNKKVSS